MLFAIAGHQKLYVAICRWLDQPGVGALVGENDSFYLEELDISRLAHANMKVIGSVNRILEKRMDGL